MPERITMTFRKDGTGSVFYSDKAVHALRPSISSVKRLSNVEFNNASGMWEVRLASNPHGPALFKARDRSECITWEHEHAADLMKAHFDNNMEKENELETDKGRV